MSDERGTSVAVGGCDADGNRTLRLVSVVEPSSPTDQIQWYLDGQPFGPAMAPGKYQGKVPGDGEVHLLELRVISPEGVAGDTAEIKFPLCSQNIVGHIRSVDFAERKEDGSLPIRLISKMEPEGTDATVQWLVDGKKLDGPVPAGVHATSVEVAGGVRQVELRVLEPEGAQGDLEDVEFPGPDVAARIAVAEFDDWDPSWDQGIAVDEMDELEPAKGIAVEEFTDPSDLEERIAVVELDDAADDDLERIAVAEFDDDDLVERIAVVELDEEPLESIAVVELDEAELAQGIAVEELDEVDVERIAVAEFENDDLVERIAVAEFDDDDLVERIAVEELDEYEGRTIADAESLIEYEGIVDDSNDEDGGDESESKSSNPAVRIQTSEVDIDNNFLVRLSLTDKSLGVARWSIDGKAVGGSPPGTALIVKVPCGEGGARVEAVTESGDRHEASFEVLPPYEFDEEATLDELMPMKDDGYRASLPVELLAYAERELTAEEIPATTALLASMISEAAEEQPEGGDAEAEAEEEAAAASAVDPWCPSGCDDWPKIEKVTDEDYLANKTNTSKKHPLRNIVIIPCLHVKVKKHHSSHSKKVWGVKIKLPCLHFYVTKDHSYDIKDVGVALSAPAKAATTAKSKERWIRALLPGYLKPKPGGLKKNVYFVNGINKAWKGADGQRAYIEQFLAGSGWDVRLIHNDGTDGMMTDNMQLNWDYRWSALPAAVQKITPLRSHGSIAIFSLLHYAMDSGTELAIVGSSGGTLQTFIGIRAFSLLGSTERAYLKSKVRLLHLGCLVHRNRYDWVRSTVKTYELHVDRRDPFARTFSGEMIPPLPISAALHEGPVLAHQLMAKDPVATGLSTGVASGLLFKQGTYHSIDHNYMRHEDELRHVNPSVFTP